jgi:hypothetical protein
VDDNWTDVTVEPDRTVVPTPLAAEVGTGDPPSEIFARLTPRERLAVVAYVESGSYTEALRAIGGWEYDHEARPSSTQANRQATAFFSQPRVRTAVGRLQAFWGSQASIQAGRVLDALEAQAFADPALIYEQDGATWNLKPLNEWPLHMRQSVQRVHYSEVTSGFGKFKRTTKRVDVDFTNRQQALALLGKHLHLFEETKEQPAPFTLVVNSVPASGEDMKQVGPQVIEGIGLQIRLPEK